MNVVIDATNLRIALILRRMELLSRQLTYPDYFGNDEIDAIVKLQKAIYLTQKLSEDILRYFRNSLIHIK